MFAWLNQFRRLRLRYVKRTDIHEALLSLGRTNLLAVAAKPLDASVSAGRFLI
jgi:hypothetical protein